MDSGSLLVCLHSLNPKPVAALILFTATSSLCQLGFVVKRMRSRLYHYHSETLPQTTLHNRSTAFFSLRFYFSKVMLSCSRSTTPPDYYLLDHYQL